MAKKLEITFKTLLSKNEYSRLSKMFSDKPANLQINYYFDTSRFTLKASEIVLRVRKRETYQLSLKRKKGYNEFELVETITEDDFKSMVETSVIPSYQINSEVSDVIKSQSLINYMSLATYRITFPYKKGKLSIDKCEYLGQVDYELEYEAITYDQGKKEFIEIIKELNIAYKKSEAKIKRAYNALKKII